MCEYGFMTRRSAASIWIDNLKNRGIKEFEFNLLPKDLIDLSSFRRAQSEERIEKIRSVNQWRSVWRIKE